MGGGRTVVSDEVRTDIRTTSEDITADAALLTRVERRKADPSVGDQELQRLAAKAEELARDIADKARIQRKLVDQATES
jgi:hypothetical protein